MRVRLLVLVVALMVTAASCDFDWLMFRFGPAHTGFSPDTSISKDAVQSSMVLNWTGTSGNVRLSSPAVANGRVYVGAHAFDAAGTTNCSGSPKTCTPLWTNTGGPPGIFFSSPAVVDGVEYVGRDKLYAFDAAGTTNCSGSPKTCAPLWSAETGNTTPGPTTVSGGVVFLGGDKFYAFDAAGTTNCSGSPKTCAPLWTGPPGSGGSAAVAGGVVYASGDKLYAFDAAGTTNCSGSPKTCAPLWTGPPGSGGAPSVSGGVVYVGGDKLYAFDAAGTTNCSGSPKTCQPLWTATTTGAPLPPAAANGVVFVSSGDCNVFGECFTALQAFDAAGTTNCSGSPKTCQPLWDTTRASNDTPSPPVAARGAVYVGSDKFYAFGLEKVSPTTSILIPSNGATLSGTATLDASASDNVKVSRVEFRLTGGSSNNALIGTATLTQFGWIAQWDTTSVPNGNYALNSVAYDPANNSGRSANVNITVQN
jgi:hypothetical protein